jgi:hypothetical protein
LAVLVSVEKSAMMVLLTTTVDGDCGSWVFDRATGDVYGHIVSGFPGTGTAYIVPSVQIFQDIQRKLRKSVELFTSASRTGINSVQTSNMLPIVPRPANVVDVDEDRKLVPGSKRIATEMEGTHHVTRCRKVRRLQSAAVIEEDFELETSAPSSFFGSRPISPDSLFKSSFDIVQYMYGIDPLDTSGEFDFFKSQIPERMNNSSHLSTPMPTMGGDLPTSPPHAVVTERYDPLEYPHFYPEDLAMQSLISASALTSMPGSSHDARPGKQEALGSSSVLPITAQSERSSAPEGATIITEGMRLPPRTGKNEEDSLNKSPP